MYEAEQDLTVVHRLFLWLANPVFLMQKAGDYWGRFYPSGEWTVTPGSRNSATARLENLEPSDDRFGRYLTAYVTRMWERVGAKEVEVSSRVEQSALHLRQRWCGPRPTWTQRLAAPSLCAFLAPWRPP